MKVFRVIKRIAVAGIFLLIPFFAYLLVNWKMILLYNEGNELYHKGNYQIAAEKYQSALDWFPQEAQECSIRINLALAVIGEIDFENLNTPQKVENAIDTLIEAKQILLEKECASETNSGHNETAQQLKEDIDRMIEQLQNTSEEEEDSQQETQESETSEEESMQEAEKQEMQAIEEQLQELENEAAISRHDDQILYEDWSSSEGFYTGDSW